MRNINEYQRGPRVITRRSHTGSMSQQVTDASSGHRYTTSAPVIRSNFESPSPWSYSYAHEHTLSGVVISKTRWVKSGNWVSTMQEGNISSVVVNDWGTQPSFNSNLYNTTLGGLNERVRGTIDLSVSLAQSGQTVRMFRVLKRFREFHDKLNWRSIVRNVANARLEYVYGVKPLMSDLYGVLDLSVDVVLKNIQTLRVRRSSRESKSGSVRVNPFEYGLVTADSTSERLFRCEIGMCFKTDGHDINKWLSLNPVSFAYEMMPYSFVLDWVLDLGSYIRNLETSLLYANSFVSGYVSESVHNELSAKIVKYRSSGSSIVESCTLDAVARRNTHQFRRTILKAYPAPRLPRFECDLGSGRLLNLAALLGSKMKR